MHTHPVTRQPIIGIAGLLIIGIFVFDRREV
jgi:hypothetical protein